LTLLRCQVFKITGKGFISPSHIYYPMEIKVIKAFKDNDIQAFRQFNEVFEASEERAKQLIDAGVVVDPGAEPEPEPEPEVKREVGDMTMEKVKNYKKK